MQEINTQIVGKTRSSYKYITLLCTLVITSFMLDSIVQNYFVSLGSHYICAALLVFPPSYMICDIIAEVYGFKQARQILWCGLFSWLISGVVINIIIKLPYPVFWSNYSVAFRYVMAPYFHNILAIFLSVVVGQYLNILAISKLKILTKGKYFWLRAVSSSFVGDFATVSLATIGVFFGSLLTGQLFKLILLEFVLGLIYEAIAAFLGMYIIAFLKKSEGIDVFDTKTNFNPFILATE